MLGGPSYMGDGFVDEWPETLERLKALDIDVILPGHGPAIRDKRRIDQVQAYYRDLWKEASALQASGVPPDVGRHQPARHREVSAPAPRDLLTPAALNGCL